MNANSCAIVLACYNEMNYVERCVLSCVEQESSAPIRVFVADDGSDDETPHILRRMASEHQNLTPIFLEHSERVFARNAAIEAAFETDFNYILVIDCDMVLPPDLIEKCIQHTESKTVAALIIPELAFSDNHNYWSRVKVFERNTIYNSGDKLDSYTIEGARFWTRDAFIESGGFNAGQIAFEDIQPTFHFRAKGGVIERITTTHILHDEKHVTLRGLLAKKAYYYSYMPAVVQTEHSGFKSMFLRWYFFRPVLYRRENIQRYIKQPHLAFGMFVMYAVLSISAVWAFRPKFPRLPGFTRTT